MVARDFVRYLLARQPDLSQSAIARRCHLSFAVINKICVATGIECAPETYRKLADGFGMEWRDFLRDHSLARRDLLLQYGWVLAAAPRVTGQIEGEQMVGWRRGEITIHKMEESR